MQKYQITITGTQPLLLHHDDIEWADRMDAWKSNPDNKKNSVPGDDRTPPFRWIGCLYHDKENVIIPTENIMRSLMEGAAMVMVPKGRNGKTFKAQSQSGILPDGIGWTLLVRNGKKVPIAPILELIDQPNKLFHAHTKEAEKMGFDLFSKRAKIGTSKHIRVRPRFLNWSATGTLTVIDPQITEEVLTNIFDCAGSYKGLGDWRPSSKTPGTWGTFSADVKAI